MRGPGPLPPSASRPFRRHDVESQTSRALYGIRELLLRGEFAPGERVSELRLVASIGVSRTPIRLALERLAHMGLLDEHVGGGFTVRGFTPSEALDAIEIRGVLEGTAARLAAERLTDVSALGAIRHFCRQMEAFQHLTLESFASYMDINASFHAAVVELARSDMLRRTIEQAVTLPFASPSAMVFPTSGMPSAADALAIAKEHHRGILDAIEKRQGTRAEALAREHAFLAHRVLELALSDSAAFNRVPGARLISK